MRPFSPKNCLKPFLDQIKWYFPNIVKDQISLLVDLGKHSYIDRQKKSPKAFYITLSQLKYYN